MGQILQTQETMKILYLTNKPIYPIVDGGCFAMDSFLRALLTFSEVKNISIATHKHPFELRNYPQSIQEKTNPEGCIIETKTNVLGFLKSIVLQQSYNAIRFYNEEFLAKIKIELKTTTYNIIILESSYLLVYIDALKKIFPGKIILRAPNVEYKIWEDYALFSNSLFKKTAYSYLAKALKKFELNACAKVDTILAITENDKFQFKQDGIHVPCEVIPFGIHPEIKELPTISSNKIFFLGAYNWKPNVDAANHLIKDLFPVLRLKYPTLELHLAGSFTPEALKSLQANNIFIHGKVDNSMEFIKNHGILVAPIFSGSGVRIKIIEALAQGIPVVASTIAMQGIPSESVLIADNLQEFVEQIGRLLVEKNIKLDLQQKALATIDSHFSQEKIADKLKNCLDVA